jgi:hypothetical protein
LCSAREVNHCDCDAGDKFFYICSEVAQRCVAQDSVCEGALCGWHECDGSPDPLCDSLADQMPNAPRICTRDSDCAEGLCSVRIDNLMVCSGPPGADGMAGAGGAP